MSKEKAALTAKQNKGKQYFKGLKGDIPPEVNIYENDTSHHRQSIVLFQCRL